MKRRIWSVVGLAALVSAVTAGVASAATIVVTPGNAASLGWSVTDNRTSGTETWTNSFGAPSGLGSGALELTTTADNSSKAYLATNASSGTSLSSVTGLSYWTYRAAGPAFGAASLQLMIDTGAATTCLSGQWSWTTLVYEPYWNSSAGAGVAGTVPSAWTQWTITPSSGVFWSSKTTCGGSLVAGAGGAPFYTLEQVLAAYPNATVSLLGVNVGSYNPSYDVAVDGVALNDTVYNFETALPAPTTADQCKNDGWQAYGTFKNQGDCVSSVVTQKHLG